MVPSMMKETNEHDDADGGGAGVVAVFQFVLDEVGDDLRLSADAAGDENDGAVFADGASEGEREAGHEGGEECGKDDAEEELACARRSPEAGGGFFDFGVEVLDRRFEGADDEGESDEDHRHEHAEARVGHLDAERFDASFPSSRGWRTAWRG